MHRCCHDAAVGRYEAELPVGAEFVAGDIRNYQEVVEALQDASVVFHVASYGMSGAESLRTDLISQVNVSGRG